MEIALMGFFGVLVGACISTITTIIIAKWQIASSLQKTKLDSLQYKIGKFEKLLFDMSEIKISIVEDNLLPQQMVGRAMLAFTEKVSLTRQYFHYLSPELITKLKALSGEVSKTVYKEKTGSTNDVGEINVLSSEVQKTENELFEEILCKLNIWQAEVEKMLLEKS